MSHDNKTKKFWTLKYTAIFRQMICASGLMLGVACGTPEMGSNYGFKALYGNSLLEGSRPHALLYDERYVDDADEEPGGSGAWVGQYLPFCERARVLDGHLPPVTDFLGPQAVSLRSLMSPVKNQQHRNTCSTFAAVALLEAALGRPLSEQCISYAAGERDTGYVAGVLQKVIRGGLTIDQHACPYDAENRDNVPHDLLRNWRPRAVSGRLVAQAFPSWREEDPIGFIRQQLAAGAPVALSLYMFDDFWFDDALCLSGNSLLQQPALSAAWTAGHPHDHQPAHSVVAVAYDDVRGVITIKNSWGTDWKDQGFAEVSYDMLRRFHSNHSRLNSMVALRP